MAVIKKLALAALGAATLSGSAFAQDARTVIADAQLALDNPQSITYSGSARDVAFQQCGANATALICYGTHDPMRPITSYVRVIDLNAPTSRHTGTTMNFGPGGSTTITPGTFFQQVTQQQATDAATPWGQSLELYITPWGFLKGAAANNATAARRTVDGKSYTVTGTSASAEATAVSITPEQYVTVELEGDGEIELTLPKSMIDGITMVRAGSADVDYEEVSESSSSTTISFTVPGGADSVDILGETVVPEFNVIALLVLAASIVSVVAYTRFKGSNIRGIGTGSSQA